VGTPTFARRCDVRTEYVSHLASRAAGYPSGGWVFWTFLSSLCENGFFGIQLKAQGSTAGTKGSILAERGLVGGWDE